MDGAKCLPEYKPDISIPAHCVELSTQHLPTEQQRTPSNITLNVIGMFGLVMAVHWNINQTINRSIKIPSDILVVATKWHLKNSKPELKADTELGIDHDLDSCKKGDLWYELFISSICQVCMKGDSIYPSNVSTSCSNSSYPLI
jgi:hypothetical protein